MFYKFIEKLVDVHPLKTLDAIHIASAILLRKFMGKEIEFVCTDNRLNNIARIEGFNVINPEESSS